MKDKEKQIEEMAKLIDDRILEANAWIGSMNKGEGYWIAQELVKHYQPKLPKDSVVLSREEYEILTKDIEHPTDEVLKKLIVGKNMLVEKAIEDTRKEMAEKILNTEFFIFEIENRSEEYQKGYMQAVRECCSRKDELAKQLGVEIKE